MCGFLGFTYKDEQRLKEGLNNIKHRGPDNSGYYFDEEISLGHNRLSIIDLTSNANQPMAGSNGTIIVFNGEIYNYKELKNGLASGGQFFRQIAIPRLF